MDETVRIDNYSFTYEKCNEREGTPLVFLHGWCSVRFFWNYCLPDFTPDYPCVNFDLLGHYHSKVSPAFYKHFDEERLFVTQKEAIQKALNTERIRLIGHSAGAFVALGIAAMFPEFVEKAVVVCPPAHGPVRGLLYPAKLANDFGLSFINYGTIDLIKLFPGLIETWFSQGAAEPKKLIAIEGMKEFLREYHEYFKENNVRMVNRYLEILDKADILHLLDQ
ncbi:MAG: alpha/beta hydrolase, partial [Leptospiraceae bacterium]|nr:alpha/beta hydrolase [Leptospiraceae bacterium]